jgi:predicted ABC-type transport system involved in lysophospholipase L1 biosynthesis ATPase subunit
MTAAARVEQGTRALLVIVTHDPAIATQSQRIIRLRDGLIENGSGGSKP